VESKETLASIPLLLLNPPQHNQGLAGTLANTFPQTWRSLTRKDLVSAARDGSSLAYPDFRLLITPLTLCLVVFGQVYF
jgi:hypothetical protein